MFRRGTIKVMNGPNGSRIQEELNNTIRIFTAEEWATEVKKREAEYEDEIKNGPKPVEKPVKKEESKDTGLIQEDEEEADDEVMAEVKTPIDPVVEVPSKSKEARVNTLKKNYKKK